MINIKTNLKQTCYCDCIYILYKIRNFAMFACFICGEECSIDALFRAKMTLKETGGKWIK